MIETDSDVAQSCERFARRLGLIKSRLSVWERRFVDQSLPAFEPRNVRVAEERETVRRRRRRQTDGFQQVFGRLRRQTVHEVEAELLDAGVTQVGDGLANNLEWLHAPYGLLDMRIEILHAKRGARHPDGGIGLGQFGRQVTRVQFDAVRKPTIKVSNEKSR